MVVWIVCGEFVVVMQVPDRQLVRPLNVRVIRVSGKSTLVVSNVLLKGYGYWRIVLTFVLEEIVASCRCISDAFSQQLCVPVLQHVFHFSLLGNRLRINVHNGKSIHE